MVSKMAMADGMHMHSACWDEILPSGGGGGAPPSARSSHQLSSHGSSLFLFGGECGPRCSHFGYGVPVATTVHTMDLNRRDDGWHELTITSGAAPSPRLGHGQCVVEEDGGSVYLYVFGGRQPVDKDAAFDGKEEIASLNDVHRLDLSAGTHGTWEELPCTGDIPSVRSYAGMVQHSGTVYVFGGMVDNDRYSDLYSFSGNTWTRLPDGPMEGRGGAGLCASPSGTSLWVVAGFCGRPVGDVWEYHVGRKEWVEHPAMKLAVPRSIFACCVHEGEAEGETEGASIVVFGGELAAASGNEEAGVYTGETLSIALGGGSGEEVAKKGEGVVQTLCLGGGWKGGEDQGGEDFPVGRGWTSGCIVEVKAKEQTKSIVEDKAKEQTKQMFAVFGGIRSGRKERGEPPGVRLGDLVVLDLL